MDDQTALSIVDKIFQMIFNQPNHFDLESLFQKLTANLRLPRPVQDTITGDITWSTADQSQDFITQTGVSDIQQTKGWMRPARLINDIDEILKIWPEINLISTERHFDSINIAKSDPIYACENAYRCTDCRNCNNIIYTEGCTDSEYLLASARSASCNFCIKTDDSDSCSNSYHVICSSKIINSLFIQDCYDLYECMFCAHISSHKYCIANMEFKQSEYYKLKPLVINHILQNL